MDEGEDVVSDVVSTTLVVSANADENKNPKSKSPFKLLNINNSPPQDPQIYKESNE